MFRKFFVLAGFMVCLVLPLSGADTPVASADQVRKELANAFEKKDIATIQTLIVDGHSGLRWFIDNTIEGFWRPVSAALREAKLKSSTKNNVVYLLSIQWSDTPAQKREINMIFGNEGWALDLNSLLGPFPSM